MNGTPTCGGHVIGKLENPSALMGFALAGLLAFANAAGIESLGIPAWLIVMSGAIPVSVAIASVVPAALVIGFVMGYCLGRRFHLKSLGDERTCVVGVVEKANYSEDHWYLGFFWDPDRSLDLVVQTSYLFLISDQAKFVRCNKLGVPLLHIEIESHVPETACIGGTIGAVAGGIAGAILSAAAAVGLATSLGCGPLVFLCLLLMIIVAAVVSLGISFICAMLGGIIGGLVGKQLDSGDDLWERGTQVGPGTCLTAFGKWVNDIDHGWNEIHPVVDFRPCGPHPSKPPYTQQDADSVQGDCPITIR